MFNLPTTNCTFLHFTLHILQHQHGRVFNQANLHWHEFIFYIAHFKYSIPYSALHFAHPLASTTSEWGSVQSGGLTLGAKSGIRHYWFTITTVRAVPACQIEIAAAADSATFHLSPLCFNIFLWIINLFYVCLVAWLCVKMVTIPNLKHLAKTSLSYVDAVTG